MTYHRFTVDKHDDNGFFPGSLLCDVCDVILHTGEPAFAVHVPHPCPHHILCPECFAATLTANPDAVEVLD